MPERKLSAIKCRELTSYRDSELTDAELENVRDCLYSFANLLLEEYLNNYDSNENKDKKQYQQQR